MAKFIKLRTVNYYTPTIFVNPQWISAVRAAVEDQDWFKHNLNQNETPPASIVAVYGSNYQTIETPEQILALIDAAQPKAEGA